MCAVVTGSPPQTCLPRPARGAARATDSGKRSEGTSASEERRRGKEGDGEVICQCLMQAGMNHSLYPSPFLITKIALFVVENQFQVHTFNPLTLEISFLPPFQAPPPALYPWKDRVLATAGMQTLTSAESLASVLQPAPFPA